MNELNYLNELVSKRCVIVPIDSAMPVINAATALGLVACGGAFIDGGEQVIYLD